MKRKTWVGPEGTYGPTKDAPRKRTAEDETVGGLEYSPGPTVCSFTSTSWPSRRDSVRDGSPCTSRGLLQASERSPVPMTRPHSILGKKRGGRTCSARRCLAWRPHGLVV